MLISTPSSHIVHFKLNSPMKRIPRSYHTEIFLFVSCSYSLITYTFLVSLFILKLHYLLLYLYNHLSHKYSNKNEYTCYFYINNKVFSLKHTVFKYSKNLRVIREKKNIIKRLRYITQYLRLLFFYKTSIVEN